jgi:hypothetical protein
MLVPVHFSRSEGMLNEFIDPGVEVRLRVRLDFCLGAAEPNRDRIRCHTPCVPQFCPSSKA